MKEFYGIGELNRAETFVMHLRFARDAGIVLGPLPIAGLYRSRGIWIDPKKAETVKYLEAVPIQEWRALISSGLNDLERKGLIRSNRAQSFEIIDRYDFDFQRVVSVSAHIPRSA